MKTNPKVDEFMNKLDHPLKNEIQRVREIILETDSKMTEDIKWGGPTFHYKRNLATINIKAKKFVNLFFQNGADINDQYGILEGDAKAVRVTRFYDMGDVEKKQEGLRAVVQEWIKLQDASNQ